MLHCFGTTQDFLHFVLQSHKYIFADISLGQPIVLTCSRIICFKFVPCKITICS